MISITPSNIDQYLSSWGEILTATIYKSTSMTMARLTAVFFRKDKAQCCEKAL
jgi:hypothetical protein